ncbi:hypothetical protein NQ318_014305 [Aromia moschata]|uniref:Uncharacterized protein n=1 Tax=Aromia moschata TaxID=1265417 RepID=A0AAV8YZ68_9CUCU|nr:hypothetical protein NQ318_014305 [Aromia moschata]
MQSSLIRLKYVYQICKTYTNIGLPPQIYVLPGDFQSEGRGGRGTIKQNICKSPWPGEICVRPETRRSPPRPGNSGRDPERWQPYMNTIDI